MSDLLIFAARPDLVGRFLSEPANMPREFVSQRFLMTEKPFTLVQRQFVSRFAGSLTNVDVSDLEYLGVVRNALAHSLVSIDREHFLYRPTGGQQREAKILRTLELQPGPESADPIVLKLTFTQERYLEDFARIRRLDEGCFARIATEVGVIHSRIR